MIKGEVGMCFVEDMKCVYKLNSVECQEARCRNLFRITVHEEHEVPRWWTVLSTIYIL